MAENSESAGPSLVPTPARDRPELVQEALHDWMERPELLREALQDVDKLRALCQRFFSLCGGERRNGIGVRTMGRLIADIHRALELPIPSEEALNRAMLPYAGIGKFALDRASFSGFIEKVLRQCISGAALGDEGEFAAFDEQSGPAVTITVNLQKPDGSAATISVQNSQIVSSLQDKIAHRIDIPKARQHLLHGVTELKTNRSLREQGVGEGALITVCHKPPQETLLRIRRVRSQSDVRRKNTSRSRSLSRVRLPPLCHESKKAHAHVALRPNQSSHLVC